MRAVNHALLPRLASSDPVARTIFWYLFLDERRFNSDSAQQGARRAEDEGAALICSTNCLFLAIRPSSPTSSRLSSRLFLIRLRQAAVSLKMAALSSFACRSGNRVPRLALASPLLAPSLSCSALRLLLGAFVHAGVTGSDVAMSSHIGGRLFSTAASPPASAPSAFALPPGNARPIITYPNSVLRKVAVPVPEGEILSPFFQQLFADMIVTAKSVEDGALGLAAPQVGVSFRVFVLRKPRFKNDDEYSSAMRRAQRRGRVSAASSSSSPSEGEEPAEWSVFINPTILARSEASELGVEGCLSVPDHPALVRRARRIEVSYWDEKGKKHSGEKWSGLPAVAFQHETDHCDGLLLIDRQQTTFLAGRTEEQELSLAQQRFQLDFFRFFEGKEGRGRPVTLR